MIAELYKRSVSNKEEVTELWLKHNEWHLVTIESTYTNQTGAPMKLSFSNLNDVISDDRVVELLNDYEYPEQDFRDYFS